MLDVSCNQDLRVVPLDNKLVIQWTCRSTRFGGVLKEKKNKVDGARSALIPLAQSSGQASSG